MDEADERPSHRGLTIWEREIQREIDYLERRLEQARYRLEKMKQENQ